MLDLDKSVQLVKKLKLTGTPMKIFKNTAFVKVIHCNLLHSHFLLGTVIFPSGIGINFMAV